MQLVQHIEFISPVLPVVRDIFRVHELRANTYYLPTMLIATIDASAAAALICPVPIFLFSMSHALRSTAVHPSSPEPHLPLIHTRYDKGFTSSNTTGTASRAESAGET